MTTVRIAAASHVGRVRARNEDSFGATQLDASRRTGEIVTTELPGLPALRR